MTRSIQVNGENSRAGAGDLYVALAPGLKLQAVGRERDAGCRGEKASKKDAGQRDEQDVLQAGISDAGGDAFQAVSQRNGKTIHSHLRTVAIFLHNVVRSQG